VERASGPDGGAHRLARAQLITHRADRLGVGPDPGQTGGDHTARELRILGEKTVSGMHGPGSGLQRDRDQLLAVEVALRRRGWADSVRLVGETNVQRLAVSVGIDGDALDAHLARRPNDANRDLTAVRNENLTKHASLRRIHSHRVIAGVDEMDVGRNGRGEIRGKKDGHVANVVGRNVAA